MKKSICAVAAVVFWVNISHAWTGALDSLKAAVPPGLLSGAVLPDAAGNFAAGGPSVALEWVSIPGGKFTMGNNEAAYDFEDAKPPHEVVVKTFEMSKTAVTVEQYAQCVTQGGCTEPGMTDYCNWGTAGRQLHPVNCVSWEQANQYARFKGARLPSEAEWEYAAKSGGRPQKYPWGNDAPDCDKAVMTGHGVYGCGNDGTMPVCSKPAGNTAQGLCDMEGNVFQWVQDAYHNSYQGAPVDGGAVEGPGSYRVTRGASFDYYYPDYLRAEYRSRFAARSYSYSNGIRLAR